MCSTSAPAASPRRPSKGGRQPDLGHPHPQSSSLDTGDMSSSLRIAIIADIHHGADHFTKKGTAAMPLLAEFNRFVADAEPALVVELGDRISDSNRESDLVLEREVA